MAQRQMQLGTIATDNNGTQFSRYPVRDKQELAQIVAGMIREANNKRESLDVLSLRIVEGVFAHARIRQEVSPELEAKIIEKLREVPRLNYKTIGEQLGVTPWIVNRTSKEYAKKQKDGKPNAN